MDPKFASKWRIACETTHVVADELLEDGGDLRHVQEVAVGFPPVQGVATHMPRAPEAGRVRLLHLVEDPVQLVDLVYDDAGGTGVSRQASGGNAGRQTSMLHG